MKKLLIVISFVIIAICLTGCQLAQVDENGNPVVVQSDNLVGIFVRINDLENNDLYEKDHIYGKEIRSEDSEGMLEGYSFEEINGVYFGNFMDVKQDELTNTLVGSLEASDLKVAITLGDENIQDVEGTINLWKLDSETTVMYPIYQQEDGKVYIALREGNGIGVRLFDEGQVVTSEIHSSRTEKNGNEVKSNEIKIKAIIAYKMKPINVSYLLMSGEGLLIKRLDYLPTDAPKEIQLGNAEYVIVETLKSDGTIDMITREVYGKDTESIYIYYPTDDGYVIKTSTLLDWENN